MTEFLPSLLANQGSIFAGIAIVLYAAITSVRKRRDVSIEELEKRIVSLETKVEKLEDEKVQAQLVADQLEAISIERARAIYLLRDTLAQHNIPDPTALAG